MEKHIIDLLKPHLTLKEKTILNIFEIVNKEAISKEYSIEKEVLEVLLHYFKDEDETKLNKIWGSDSIQRDIFFSCIKIWDAYALEKELTEEKIGKIVKREFLKEIFLKFSQEIIRLCKYSEEENHKNIYFYKSDILKIAVVKSNEYEVIKGKFSSDEVYFRIIFDGIVMVDETLLFKGDGYFSYKKPILEKCIPITKEYSQIIIAIKNKVLKELDIEFLNVENKKFSIGNLKLFDFLIKKREIKKENYFYIFQIFIYLAQMVKEEKIELFDIPYLEYKRKIVKEVEESYLEDERHVVDKLTASLGLSIPTLYKIFNVLFEESPTKYIERKKLNYASGLLIKTKESVENISSDLGYSQRTFSKKFLEFSGYVPTKFREMMVK